MINTKLVELEEKICDRDRMFCKYLIINNGNAYQAAMSAGFAKSTAKARSAEWVRPTRDRSRKPILFDYHKELLKSSLKVADITIEALLIELKSIAHSDITKIVEIQTGLVIKVKSSSELPEAIKPAIQAITKSSYGITIKLYDKIEAIRMLLDFHKQGEDDGSKGKGSLTIENVTFNVKGSQSRLLENHG